MADRLHKFIPLHEILQQAGRFHDRASTLLTAWAREQNGARAGSFLELAAKHEREVAESLAARLAAHQDLASAEAFYQNPPETIPSEGDLQTLAAHRQDLDALAAGLHDLHERWVAVYKTLQATNSTRHVTELVASCRELIERLERQLSSAQVQLQDL